METQERPMNIEEKSLLANGRGVFRDTLSASRSRTIYGSQQAEPPCDLPRNLQIICGPSAAASVSFVILTIRARRASGRAFVFSALPRQLLTQQLGRNYV